MKLSRFAFMTVLVFCLLFSSSLLAQAPAALAFEVASVKPLPPLQTLTQEIVSGKRSFTLLHGATVSGAQFDGMASLTDLVTRAYNIQPTRLVGPEWMRSQLFEIHAKMPEGASKDQIPQMLQTLLAERFKLVARWEKRNQPVYALIVSKDGHKLKEAVPAESSAKTGAETDGAGKGKKRTVMTPFGRTEVDSGSEAADSSGRSRRVLGITEAGLLVEFSRTTMPEFAETLAQYIDRPVLEMTGLNGSYQVTVELPRKMSNIVPSSVSLTGPSGVPPASGLAGVAASDPSGGVVQSLQKLGLRLDSRRAQVDMLIIDQIEKNPTSD